MIEEIIEDMSGRRKKSMDESSNERRTLQIRVYGVVQGVGFRPTVSRHAMESGICGNVCNKGPYVEILAQGTKKQTDIFLELLEKKPPRRAAILKIDVHEINVDTVYSKFDIIESEKTAGEIFISPDIAICDECKKELFDPKDRRYLHPFINCTCCGPRLTILDALPYDRERTSMKKFLMCPECESEYYDPESRRYDAQPVCCPDCGPEVYLVGRKERGKAAITEARRIVSGGGIIAVKGIGGFHLCCDATNEKAISRLRELKHRPKKPFAVMMKDEQTVHRECELSGELEEILTGHQKPILLLQKKSTGNVPEICAPDNSKLGVMLPYAPVQLLLFSYDDDVQMPDCLVMTSGNDSGAPICRDDEDAKKSLAHLCDAILSNNREIRVRADDTVMDVYHEEPYMIRRSRGYAPLPFMVTREESQKKKRCVLGIGGELKNSFTIEVNDLYYPSPYIGDLADIRTVQALKETIIRMETLLEVETEMIACDMHPRYQSVQVAETLGKERKLSVVNVQHHYAHILSCMAENDYLDPVIGVAFDGTGYGTDGTIWGGELLLADVHGFRRLASIQPFLQIGGDASSREGWRIAVSMIRELTESKEEAWALIEKFNLCDKRTFQIQYHMAERKINCVESTSVGRLFDAVSAILGVRRNSTFEGEASMALQHYAEKALADNRRKIALCAGEKNRDGEYFGGKTIGCDESGKWILRKEDRLYLNTKALVKMIIDKKLEGDTPESLAYLFHEKLAEMVADCCVETRRNMEQNEAINTVVLSGGVFQNTLLLDLCESKLKKDGFQVLRHHMIPPNDGGISIGQALYASFALDERKREEL